jgi:hypothetical protein
LILTTECVITNIQRRRTKLLHSKCQWCKLSITLTKSKILWFKSAGFFLYLIWN